MSDKTDKAELIAHYSQLPLDIDYLRLVAHDVRNQINTIMMANDMMREELKDIKGNSQKYVSIISRASEEILGILEAVVTTQAGRGDIKTVEES